MKNVEAIVSRAEIHDYVRSLWKTDVFRRAHDRGGLVTDVVDAFARLPRLFVHMSNPHLEKAHFSTWWNAMTHRDDYTNPIIADLYWLHEMHHAGKMPYVRNIGRAAFDEKMQRNELEASVLSEIQIYFAIPALRPLSFPHPIYADRFLADPEMQALWQADREVAIETIRTIRRDVMVSKPVETMDETELWIRRFAEQNMAYSIIWSDRYQEIENHMADFQIRSITDRKGALAQHQEWLEREAAKDAVDNIPFRMEAELFSAHYWANKEKYERDVAAKPEAA